MGRPAITSKCLSSEDTCLSLQQQVSWLMALAASHTFSLFAMVSCDTPSTYSDRIAWDSHPIPFYLSWENTGCNIQFSINCNKKPAPQLQQCPASVNAKMLPVFLQMHAEPWEQFCRQAFLLMDLCISALPGQQGRWYHSLPLPSYIGDSALDLYPVSLLETRQHLRKHLWDILATDFAADLLQESSHRSDL